MVQSLSSGLSFPISFVIAAILEFQSLPPQGWFPCASSLLLLVSGSSFKGDSVFVLRFRFTCRRGAPALVHHGK